MKKVCFVKMSVCRDSSFKQMLSPADNQAFFLLKSGVAAAVPTPLCKGPYHESEESGWSVVRKINNCSHRANVLLKMR